MGYFSPSTVAVALIASSFLGVSGFNSLTGRDDFTSDVCGEVDADLQVPNKFALGGTINLGRISACICISGLPGFIATNPLAISGGALAGQSSVVASLTDMINKCPGQQCSYPPHSVPVCQRGYPCGFTCKDGYAPYPASRPTQCICSKPFTECNGKCGIYPVCASGHIKRDMSHSRNKICPWGLTACGIWGRSAQSWECVDTQNDLESCGGCMMSLHPNLPEPDGVDCTSLPGVSDVSCIQGSCSVHRCMLGYELNSSGTACVYSEDKDPAILALQYGVDYVPI